MGTSPSSKTHAKTSDLVNVSRDEHKPRDKLREIDATNCQITSNMGTPVANETEETKERYEIVSESKELVDMFNIMDSEERFTERNYERVWIKFNIDNTTINNKNVV